jgi:ParB family chromosome partitioning protein
MNTSAPKTKSRLGRGLSSLISADTTAPVVSLEISEEPTARISDTPAPNGVPIEIPLAEIFPNPHQPRRDFKPESLNELAASLKSTGMIQPVVVRKRQQEGGYQLIAGERRWRAAKLAGLEAVPAIIRDVDGYAQAQMALVENIQRENLNPLERAQAYRSLIEQLGLTQAELAARLGEDRSSIANHVRILELPESVRQLIRDGKLSLGHAKLLSGARDPLEQERLANLAIVEDLSVRNLERLIQGTAAKPPPAAPAAPSAYLSDLEKSLTRQLGLRVFIRAARKKGKGKLIVQYNSLDEFDRLLSILGVKAEES